MNPQPPEDSSALQQVLEQLAGVQAELAALRELFSDTSLTREQHTPYTSQVQPNLVKQNQTIEKPMTTTQQIPLRPPKRHLLKPGRRPQQKFKHHCQVCDGEWIGNEPQPPSCSYCRSTIWQTGETKWALRRKSDELGESFA